MLKDFEKHKNQSESFSFKVFWDLVEISFFFWFLNFLIRLLTRKFTVIEKGIKVFEVTLNYLSLPSHTLKDSALRITEMLIYLFENQLEPLTLIFTTK